MVVPLLLQTEAGLAISRHWQVYLPVLGLSVLGMLPLLRHALETKEPGLQAQALAAYGAILDRLSVHYAEIQRGIVDLRNLVYFITMTGLFLVLNTLSLDGRRY